MTCFDFERCWQTGEYIDQICSMCPHNSECSGGQDEDDED